MELIRLLPTPYDGHIHSDQLSHIGRDPRCRAVTNLFIITDVEINRSHRAESSIHHGFDRRDQICYTSLIVEEARADESVRHFDARIECYTVTDIDSQL